MPSNCEKLINLKNVSVPMMCLPCSPQLTLNIIKDLLDKDTTLKKRTVMEVRDIILLLEFCLKNTYFSFQGQFYEQVEGAAMGSPVNPIVANLYMEYLEQKALSTDQYLQWDSHHHLSAKFSVIQTLSHRASTMCSNPELLQKEKDHLRKALIKCKYPKWALDKVEKRLNRSSRQANDGATTMPSLLTMECKTRGTLSYPTHKVFVKVSKRSVVRMASKFTSKVAESSKATGLPQGQRPYGQL